MHLVHSKTASKSTAAPSSAAKKVKATAASGKKKAKAPSNEKKAKAAKNQLPAVLNQRKPS